MKILAVLPVLLWASLVASEAWALQLSPIDFPSLGSLTTTSDVVLNTDTMQLSGGTSFTGVLDSTSHAAVFTFDTIQTANVSVIGSNPLALLSKGDAVLNGTVTASNIGGFEIVAGGNVSLTNGASISVLNGSSLSIFSQDLQLVGGAQIASSGNVTLATRQGLIPIDPIMGGNLTLVSQSGTNLFHSFDAFNVQPDEVHLFTGNITLQGSSPIILSGVTVSSNPGGIASLTIVAGPPVPLPAAAILFVTGLAGLGGLVRRRAYGSKT